MKKILIKLVVCLSFAVWTVPLSAQVTVDIDSMPLTEALKKLEEQTGYSFSIVMSFRIKTLSSVLNRIIRI